MPRLLTASPTLVLQRGQPALASPYLALEGCARISAPGSETIALVLEPVEESPRARQVAQDLAERLIEEIQARRGQTTTAALLAAIELINGWLVQLNAVRPPRERCYFGFTCMLTRDDEAYVAQAAPSQILIAQEGEIYAFPGLESWRWHTRETTDSTAVALPLGLGETQPDLYHTRLAAGDLLVLCSSSLARVIDRAPQVAFAQGDTAIVLDHLDELARLFAVSDAWAAAVVVPEPVRQERRHERGGDLAFLRRASSWFSHFLPEETAERLRRHTGNSDPDEVDLSDEAVHTVDYTAGMTSSDVAESLYWDDARGSTADFPIVTGATAPSADALLDEAPTRPDDEPDERYWEPETGDPHDIPDDWESDAALEDAAERPARGRGVNDLLAVALLAFSAAVVGVRQLTINRDRSLGPRDDGTLGVPRLSRYDDNIQLPEFRGVRSRMPRVPLSRTVALALVILLITFGAAVTVSVRNKHERQRQARMTALFQNAESLRQRATESSDPAAVQNILQAASASITRAEAFGLDQDQAAREQTAISADRDQALKIDRLANIQVLGSLPAAPRGVTPRIFAGNGQIYVFTDALYRLDANGNALVRLIGGGDQIGGQPVATLLGAAWGDGAPVVFDGSRAYLFDPPTGSWHAQQVETLGGPETGIAAINGYSGNLYLLSPQTGQIVKYGAGAYDNQPEDWTAGAATDDLKQAVDFVIDGHIYVLTKDGRVIDFFMSAEQSTVTPHAVPPVTNAVALSLQTDRPYVYIAERDRILRLERSSGNLVQQFVAGSDAPPFNDIRAFSVDDVLGTAYILNGNALLSVRLPGPPH